MFTTSANYWISPLSHAIAALQRFLLSYSARFSILTLLLVAYAYDASALPVNLVWDPPTDWGAEVSNTQARQYKLYRKVGVATYDTGQIIAVTTCTIAGVSVTPCPMNSPSNLLVSDGSYAYKVTALNTDGLESTFSNEVFVHMLNVSVQGTGSGNVTSTSINCGAGQTACSRAVGAGDSLTFQATPSTGSNFTGWSGGTCSGTASTCTVANVGAPVSVTATFSPVQATQFALTVNKLGSGAGTVTSTPSGISCTTGVCSANFNNNTAVTLSAAAGSGATFAGWTGDCSGVGTCSVTMNQTHSVSATFNTLSAPTISAQPQNITVTAPAAASFSVTATATSAITYQWQRAAPATPTTFVSVTGATSATYQLSSTSVATDNGAKYRVLVSAAGLTSTSTTATLSVQAQPLFGISVLKTGSGAVDGIVTALNGAQNLFTCGSTCTANVVSGITVTLQASLIASTNSLFIGWRDGNGNPISSCPSTASCVLPITAATNIQARFDSRQILLADSAMGTNVAPMISTNDDTAVGGAYSNSGTNNAGSITIPFNVANAGTYFVWARLWTSSTLSGTYFVSLAGSSEDTFDVIGATSSASWQWVRVNGRNGTNTPRTLNPRTFSLGAGQNSFIFRNGVNAIKLDALLLTNDPNFMPGISTSPTSSVTVNITGAGQVMANGIQCPGDCTEVLPVGTVVPLAALGLSGSSISSWGGACTAGASVCNVLIAPGANTINVSFIKLTPSAPSGLMVVTGP